MLDPILRTICVVLGLGCFGMIFALTTVYARRTYAYHVVPMGVAAMCLIGILIHRAYEALPTWETGLLTAALAIKCYGLAAILNRVQARADGRTLERRL